LTEDLKARIRLPDRFRFLREGDVDQPFQTGDKRMDRYVLRDYFQWSLLPNDLVILYEIDGKLAGIVEMTVHTDYIEIEMLGRNILVDATGVGTKLMSFVENIARQLGRREIRLEALDSVVEWYDAVLGYEEYSDAVHDYEFGRLTPKRKSIL